MTSTLSVYLSNHHDLQSTWDYIRALQPAWVRIHQPTARTIHMVQQAAPNASIMLRSWDIDDHNGDRKRELYADPKGAAHQHLAMWRAKWDELIAELHRNGWGYNLDRWCIGLVNEPDPAHTQQVVEYSLEAMRSVQGTSIRLGLVWSSVGTFSKPSENDHGWARFTPLEEPINAGGHILGVHSYWQPEGPTFGEDAGNLAWRHRHIPLDVPILIGEAGANGYIYGRHSQQDDAGWRKFMQPEQYAAQVHQYIEGCDQRVQGVCLYMTDYHSPQWESFDTTPAHSHLLAIKDVTPQVPNPYAERKQTHIPVVSKPQPTQPTQPTGDDWPRIYAFLKRWEGGFVHHPSDPGGATNKGITIGTFIRWRVERGQPTPSVDDLRAITDAEVEQIYFEWYWKASGADRLPWPLCLAHFDTAVNAGVGRAAEMMQLSKGDFLAYMGHLMSWYTRIQGFEHFGRAWIRRRAEILLEATL